MMNNVVLMFSSFDEKTPYEQGENCTVTRFSRRRELNDFVNAKNQSGKKPLLLACNKH